MLGQLDTDTNKAMLEFFDNAAKNALSKNESDIYFNIKSKALSYGWIK